MPWFKISHGTATSSKLTCSRYRAPAIAAAEQRPRISGVKWWYSWKTYASNMTHVDLASWWASDNAQTGRCWSTIFAVFQFCPYSIKQGITRFSRTNESQNCLVSWLSLPKLNLPNHLEILKNYPTVYLYRLFPLVSESCNKALEPLDKICWTSKHQSGIWHKTLLETWRGWKLLCRVWNQHTALPGNSSCLILSGCILCCFLKPFSVAAHSRNEMGEH